MTPWDVAYEGTPTWDTGRPQGAVLRLLEAGLIVGRVLDAGCGTGEHARLIAAAGHPVVGIDVSSLAIAKARAKAPGADGGPVGGLGFVVGDALELGPGALAGLGGPFDTALDVGLFHILQPDDRRRYARSLARAVSPGGLALVVCWSARNPFGYGPQRITRTMLRRSFVGADGWTVESIEPDELETRLPPGRVHAWLARIRRR